ncbi:LamG-like jellyroll fold domain-containing protein [Micromonospora sp. NPDC003197]
MKTPTFTAGLSDADANNLTGYLEIRKAADDTLAYGPVTSATIPAGGVITWPTLPSAALELDTNYYYQARARDTGGAYGPYTPRCYFVIDATDPGVPTISSTDYPDGAEGVAAGTVGTVTINPASGDDDIAGYRYGFDDAVGLWAPADDSGKATIPITLWANPSRPRPPVSNLWVKAVDKAGNERAEVTGPRTLMAAVSSATAVGKPGDMNGDGRADVTAVLDMGEGRTAAWSFLSSTGGFHAPVINWDSGINGRYAAGSIKTGTGDFDNDGRTDTVMFRQDRDGQVRLFNLRSDTNQYRADWSERSAGTWLLSDARVFAGDFNGDGIDDAAAIVNDRAGGWTAYVYTSTGTSFDSAATWYTQPAGTYTWTSTKTIAGDFNGDGKTDIAVAQDTTGTRTTLRVHTSTGSTFDAGSQWWDSDADTDPEQYTGSAAKYAVANLGGSGADDIVAMYNHGAKTTIKVFTAASSAFSTPTTWWDSDTGSSDGWDWRKTAQFSVGDFDGDGDLDLAAIVDCCQPGSRELWTFPNSGTGFGQVAKQGNATATTARAATAHWRIDEGTGGTLTDAGDSYPATLAGPAWNSSGHIVGTKALRLDGTNDYATTGRSIVDTSRSYSVAAWVKLDNTTTYRTIASQDGSSLSGFYLQYSKAFNAWAFVVPSTDSATSATYWAAKDSVAPRLGVWTHLVGVYDAEANQLKLYVNGVLRGSSSRSEAWSANGPFQIGKALSAHATSGDWWAGDVDDVQIYDVALNGTEASQIARETTPAGHWKLDTASGATADASGNNRNLALVGATTGGVGKNGEGLTLNGTSSYATAPNAINTTTGYTFCAWAKLDNVADLTYRTVLSQEATRSSGFWLRTSPNRKWEFVTSYTDNSYSSVESTTMVTADTWAHICASWDAGTSQMLLFVNGNLEGAKVVPAGVAATGLINIGRYKYMDNYGGYFAGVIDDMQIYAGTILDPIQIRAIMNGS